MGNVTFSILIPVYNVEKYVVECLDSVVNQTCEDYEVIVIDDGSTDKSGAICDSYAEKYPKIRVFHQENQGLMMSRKNAIINAKGEYCLFLDSDDYYDVNLLSKASEYIEKTELDVLIFNYARLYKKKKYECRYRKKTFEILTNKEAISLFMRTGHYNSVVTKIIRTDILQNHLDNIYIRVNYMEDALQTAHILAYAKKVGVLDEPLYYYRMRKSSLIHQISVRIVKETLMVSDKILSFLKQTGCVQEDDETAYCNIVLNDFLERIYRLNTNRKIPFKKRKEMLRFLLKDELAVRFIECRKTGQLAFYNKVRLSVYKKEKYNLLIAMDFILEKIQRIQNKVKRKVFFD